MRRRGESDLEVSVGLALRGRGIELAKVQKVMVLLGQLGVWASLRFFFVGAVDSISARVIAAIADSGRAGASEAMTVSGSGSLKITAMPRPSPLVRLTMRLNCFRPRGRVVDGPGLEGSGAGGSGNGSPRLRILVGSFGREGTAGSELRSGSGSAWGTGGSGGRGFYDGEGERCVRKIRHGFARR